MKKTEAISILATSVRPREAKDRARYDEAVKMAIEALRCSEIPNSSDSISRQAAIDAIGNLSDEIYGNIEKGATFPPKAWFDGMAQAEHIVRNLPPAQPEVLACGEGELSAYPEQRWIPCSERLPSETVIATVETKLFKHRYVCEAVWIPRCTRKVLFDEWEDCSEYKEDDDEYYALEGWYERVYNWDEYAYVAIDDNVIAWMPLPEPYKEGGEQE